MMWLECEEGELGDGSRELKYLEGMVCNKGFVCDHYVHSVTTLSSSQKCCGCRYE